MLTAAERERVHACACIPEQVPEYVTAISGAEPYLVDEHLCYVGPDGVTVVGYRDIATGPTALAGLVAAVAERFRPRRLAVIAAVAPAFPRPTLERASDRYYRVDLRRDPPAAVRSMVRRAAREVDVHVGRALGDDHRAALSRFVDQRAITGATRAIFERVPDYVQAVETSRVFTAVDRAGRLAAFTVAELGARDHAFYMFNVGRRPAIPGVSDLLLHEVLAMARAHGRTFVNLGLGISPGIEAFKRKWGATPFLDYEHRVYRVGRPSFVEALLGAL